MPTWVGVVTALSLAAIALAAVAAAVALAALALRVQQFLRLLEHVAGPAVDDARLLVATIKTEAEALAGTSRDIRGRIVRAADAAEARLDDLGALLDVVQGEVEETAVDIAATVRDLRRGFRLWNWTQTLLGRGKRRRRR